MKSPGLGILALVLCLAAPAFADEMRAQVSVRSPRSRAASLAPLAGYGFGIAGPLSGDLSARLALSPTHVQSTDYQGEARFEFFHGLTAAVRLLQVNRPDDGIAFTQLSARLEGVLRPVSFFELYGTFGWHERFVSLDASIPLPFASGVSFRDHDIAVRMGFAVMPAIGWRGSAGIGTIEEMDIHNLNSPFAETTLEYGPSGETWTLLALARYRLLLGFGRLAEWQGLVGMKWDLTRLGAFGS